MTSTTRNRVRKGVREGGQYSTELRSEDGSIGLLRPASAVQLNRGLRGMEEQFPGLLVDAQPGQYDRTAVHLGFLSVEDDSHLVPAMEELKKLVETSGFDALEVPNLEDAFPDLDQNDAEALVAGAAMKTTSGVSRWDVPRAVPIPSLVIVPDPDPVAEPAPVIQPAPAPVVVSKPKRKARALQPIPVPDLPAPPNEDDLEDLDPRREAPSPVVAPMPPLSELNPSNYDGTVPIPAEWITAAASGFTRPDLQQAPAADEIATGIGHLVSQRAFHLAGTTPEQVATSWEWRNSAMRNEIDSRVKESIFDNSDRFRDAQLLSNGRDPETLKAMRQLSDGYLAALREIRPMGGQLEYHPDSQPSAEKLLNEATKYFPADWIQDANTGRPLLAKKTSARAHYRNQSFRTSKKDAVSRYYFADGGDHLKDDLWSSYKISEDQSHPSTRPDRDGVYFERTRYEVKSVGGMYKRTKAGAPYGGGWERYTHNGNEYWRRPRQQMSVDTKDIHSEITVGGKRTQQMANMTQDLDVAIHELAHRHEYTVEGLYDLENKFRTRRTTLEDGTLAPIERINPRSRKEVTRPDHFAHRYMGRIYDHSATEIMSMGMESIFTGTQGGLIGVGDYHADPDMRAFILGTLAIVPGAKESPSINGK